MMNSILRVLTGPIVAMICVVGAAGCSSEPHPTTPVRVGIELSSMSGATVLVSVGRDRPVRVQLDTGSVGLRVLDTAVPAGSGSDIGTSGEPDREVYADGTIFRGFVARAVVHIGGLSTTSTVPFESITHVGCEASAPHCPGLNQSDPNVVGTLGIGMAGNDATLPTNPLLNLPAPYDRSWSVHLGRHASDRRLTLGAPAPRSPQTVLHLAAGDNPPFPARTWNDSPDMCWRITAHTWCGATTFDTGASPVYVTGYPQAPHGGLHLPRGRIVTLSARGTSKPVWTFTSGTSCCSAQAVVLLPNRHPTLDTGLAFFNTHLVTFDNRRGRIDIN
jgi:hypothetical protein